MKRLRKLAECVHWTFLCEKNERKHSLFRKWLQASRRPFEILS